MRISAVLSYLALVGAIVCVSCASQNQDNLDSSLIEKGRGRQKRELTWLERIAIKGKIVCSELTWLERIAIKALNKLLKGSEQVHISAKQRTYEKYGDWRKAQQDFDALRPSGIRRPKTSLYKGQGEVVFGRKGNLRIRLIERDPNLQVPTIELIKSDTKSGPYIEKFIYRTRKRPN